MQSDFSLDGNGLPVVAIELLPALPANWKDGSVKGLRARGGYTVDITWRDGQVINYRIRNSHGGTVTMRYNGKEELVKADKE